MSVSKIDQLQTHVDNVETSFERINTISNCYTRAGSLSIHTFDGSALDRVKRIEDLKQANNSLDMVDRIIERFAERHSLKNTKPVESPCHLEFVDLKDEKVKLDVIKKHINHSKDKNFAKSKWLLNIFPEICLIGNRVKTFDEAYLEYQETGKTLAKNAFIMQSLSFFKTVFTTIGASAILFKLYETLASGKLAENMAALGSMLMMTVLLNAIASYIKADIRSDQLMLYRNKAEKYKTPIEKLNSVEKGTYKFLTEMADENGEPRKLVRHDLRLNFNLNHDIQEMIRDNSDNSRCNTLTLFISSFTLTSLFLNMQLTDMPYYSLGILDSIGIGLALFYAVRGSVLQKN